MRSLVVILILLGLSYGGYLFWQQSRPSSTPQLDPRLVPPNLTLQDEGSVLKNLESVLGASINSGLAAVQDTLSTATAGKSEPIINQAIANFQQELSKLPEDQMKKIQYNYCKSIVEEYEKTN